MTYDTATLITMSITTLVYW